jgi:AcrR family transcriptional regulator
MPRRKTRKAAKPARAYHHGDLRAALIHAALEMLEQDGAAGLSLRAVAKAVGVSEAAPYHHFADKEALERALAAEGFGRLTDRLTGALTAAGPGEDLLRLAAAYVGFALDARGLFRLMGRLPLDRAQHDELAALSEGTLAPLAAAVARRMLPWGADADIVGFAALALWTQLHGLAEILLSRAADQDPARYGPRLVQLMEFFEDGLEAATRGQIARTERAI